MELEIVNEYTLTQKLYIDYFKKHVFKIIRIIMYIIMIISIIQLIILLIGNIAFQIPNSGGILLVLFDLILSIIICFVLPNVFGWYYYNKIYNTDKNLLKRKFIFNEVSFYIYINNDIFEEKIINIEKVYCYKNFILLKMNDKKRFILENTFDKETLQKFLTYIKK